MLPWGAAHSSFPARLLRGHWIMIAWELFTLSFVLYVMVEVPYKLAFGIPSNLGWPGNAFCQFPGKVGFDVISCIVFLVDIGVQLHSAFFIGTPGRFLSRHILSCVLC